MSQHVFSASVSTPHQRELSKPVRIRAAYHRLHEYLRDLMRLTGYNQPRLELVSCVVTKLVELDTNLVCNKYKGS